MTVEPTPPSITTIVADPRAARRIAEEARGRTLLVDCFATQCCTGVLVGDLETRWLDHGRDAGLEPIGTVNGTPIVANPDLTAVLRAGGARLVAGGLRGRSLQVRLDVPEAWVDFLATPTARRLRGRAPRGPASPTPHAS